MTKRGTLDALHTEVLEAADNDDVTGMQERIATTIEPILQAGAPNASLGADAQAGDVVLLAAGFRMPTRLDAAQTQRLLVLELGALRPA
ncbi:hypothetical protein [Kocuria sabuli]|uniref:hypothetical protein n=1 Tax=Kocuria sabuli TaxID=3071448 RepID=UPI0034D49EA3